MGKIKVVHVIPSLERGGTEKLLYDILPRLDRELFDVTICCSHQRGFESEHEKFQEAGVKTFTLSPFKGRLDRIWKMLRFLRDGRFEIVHIHNYDGNVIYARLGAILARSPVIMTYDHDIRREMWKDTLVWRLLNPFTYKNVAISRPAMEYRLRRCGGQPHKVVVVWNGIELEAFRPPSKEEAILAKVQLGFSPEDKIVGAIGRLVAWKRFDLVIKVAAALKDVRRIRFILHGQGPLETELKALADDLGVCHLVRFSSWQEDIRHLYHALDAVVVTSNATEGFGLVAVEAMASGVPVVAVDESVHREVIGEAGLIVRAEPESIARGVLRVLEDEELRAALAVKGRKRAEERFDINRQVHELTQIYLQASTRSRSKGGAQ